jgi:group I intron endonuclease
MLHKCGVYVITNTVDGRVYVGSTAKSFRRRWSRHVSLLKKGKHENGFLQRAWDKYGEQSFKFEILELCDSCDVLAKEQDAINVFDACNRAKGYNLKAKVTTNLGFKKGSGMSEERRRSQLSPEYRDRLVKMSHDLRDNMPEVLAERGARLRKKYADSPEMRDKAAAKTKLAFKANPSLAENHSQRMKQNMRDPDFKKNACSNLEAVRNDPIRHAKRNEKVREALSRPGVRAKIGAAIRALWADPEYRTRMLAKIKTRKRRSCSIQ